MKNFIYVMLGIFLLCPQSMHTGSNTSKDDAPKAGDINKGKKFKKEDIINYTNYIKNTYEDDFLQKALEKNGATKKDIDLFKSTLNLKNISDETCNNLSDDMQKSLLKITKQEGGFKELAKILQELDNNEEFQNLLQEVENNRTSLDLNVENNIEENLNE